MKSRLRTCVLAAGVVALVATVIFHASLLRTAGRALVVDEPLAPADVIVVPEWTQAAGALEAADLVHQGLASRVVILLDTPDVAEAELVRRGVLPATQTSWLVNLVRQLQVPSVEILANSGNGTEAESRVLPQWCDQQQWRTIIVVSLPDHSRRLRRLTQRSMRGHATRVIVRTTRYSSFNPDAWWLTRGGIRVQLQESQKLLLDVALHPFS